MPFWDASFGHVFYAVAHDCGMTQVQPSVFTRLEAIKQLQPLTYRGCQPVEMRAHTFNVFVRVDTVACRPN